MTRNPLLAGAFAFGFCCISSTAFAQDPLKDDLQGYVDGTLDSATELAMLADENVALVDEIRGDAVYCGLDSSFLNPILGEMARIRQLAASEQVLECLNAYANELDCVANYMVMCDESFNALCTSHTTIRQDWCRGL